MSFISDWNCNSDGESIDGHSNWDTDCGRNRQHWGVGTAAMVTLRGAESSDN